jgi:uncharacterized membrane protein YbhN (UPF0104 family)
MSRSARMLVKLALTAAILGVTLWLVGVDRIVAAITRLDPATWAIAFAGFFVVHGLGTFKWRYFMRLSGARIGVRDGFRCYAAGLFANLCLPTMIGGDVVRAGLAMAAIRKKTAVVLGSLVDRLSDFLALGTLALAGFVVAWHPASGHHPGDETSWTPFVAAGAAGLVVLAAGVVLWRRWRPRGRFHKLLLELLVALRRLRSRAGRALAGLLVSIVLQFVLLLVNRELGIRIGMPKDLSIWLFIWPLAKLVAMIPISFGGIGVREAAFLTLGKPFGIAESVAVASSLAWQAVMLVGGVASGAAWLLLTWRPEAPVARAERRAT